jgi:hypothetical protein
MSITLIF